MSTRSFYLKFMTGQVYNVLSNTYLVRVESLLFLGWYFTPEFFGTRIIFFFGWFTGFMCYIAYSAQLVSILSVEVIPIKSFEDLLRDQFFLYNDNHIPTTKFFLKVVTAKMNLIKVKNFLNLN